MTPIPYGWGEFEIIRYEISINYLNFLINIIVNWIILIFPYNYEKITVSTATKSTKLFDLTINPKCLKRFGLIILKEL